VNKKGQEEPVAPAGLNRLRSLTYERSQRRTRKEDRHKGERRAGRMRNVIISVNSPL